MSGQIYLDHQATTPLDPNVLEAMQYWLSRPANPHSMEHGWGMEAEAAVAVAREQVAGAVNGHPDGVIFTGNATEAANIVVRSFSGPDRKIVVSAIEHPCVSETARACREFGTTIQIVKVNPDGIVDLDALAEHIDSANLVSVMAVNNEIGTVQPVEAIASLCKESGTAFHSDAAQALGKVAVNMSAGIDFATLSAHKVYGPPGIGAICANRERIGELKPLVTGGGQQEGIRPGTVPVALCVGFGKACELARARLDEEKEHCGVLSALFLERLKQETSCFSVNGSLEERVPQNLSLSFSGIVADELIAMLPQIALSTGSACSSGAIAPSRVLLAMELPQEVIEGSIRVGFGRTTTEEEAVEAATAIGSMVRRLRGEVDGRMTGQRS
ncbi:MAG: cysteine desulfurase [Chloroflexi bacterium]|nr:cysteine desulfurase [Chloroflexota bacterium]